MSEELIIRQCSPTLAGLKTGNLFSCNYSQKESMKKEICRINKILVPKGIRMVLLRLSKQKALIYVYRPGRLRQDLSDSQARRLLKEMGYPCDNPEKCIVHLRKRLQENDKFPHETGLFLGYPPEDVCGFIENKAGNYKCVGCWKVYGDEEKAKKMFGRYRRCTDIYFAQWLKGVSMERLTIAAL